MTELLGESKNSSSVPSGGFVNDIISKSEALRADS
jgi:hypothetical protein